MSLNKKLDAIQLEFIFESVAKGIKQNVIAGRLGVSASCVNKILRPKAKVILMDNNIFDIDKAWKECYNY